MTTTLYQGDCLEVMRTLPERSVHCAVTSPPYWGLRDYGIPGQVGLEETPEAYTARLVEVFREVWRVLRDDGTLWLNLGDSYATQPGKGNNIPQTKWKANTYPEQAAHRSKSFDTLKPKDLVGIPWRVAFALQADGWYLRSDIIWAKPNCMPESVKDRPTRAHEYIFLLTKNEKYFYDANAVKEENSPTTGKWGKSVPSKTGRAQGNGRHGGSSIWSHEISHDETIEKYYTNGRNRRTVWTIPTHPYPGAHFATYPPQLIEPCILAGCPVGGVVLDPFNGAGTTGLVCLQNNRDYIGIDINPAYLDMTRERLAKAQPALLGVTA